MPSVKEEQIICKNCGNHFSGKFCNQCGQASDTDRLTFKVILHDIFHAFTHMDKGYLYSIKELIVRPGHTVREYIQGKKVSHASPFLMLLIIGGISSALYYKLNITSASSINTSEINGSLHVIASKFFSVLFIVICFILSLVERILFSYKKYYYSELLVFNVFLSVEVMLLNTFLIPVWLYLGTSHAGDYIRILVFFIIVLYFIMARQQFFEADKDRKTRKRLLLDHIVLIGLIGAIGWKTFSKVFLSLSNLI